MTIEAQILQELQAQRELLQAILRTQERQASAAERLAEQFDNATAGGNAMSVEVVDS